MSGWMEKNIYIVSGLMGEREWTSASSSAISRLYFYYSHRTWVKWKLMARNDLVFWPPLKYLIFEVCRWLSGADWNARAMAGEGRWIRVTSAKRQEIDWRSHPSGNEKPEKPTRNVELSEGQHHRTFPMTKPKNVSVRGSSECGRRNENAIEKTNQRLHNRFLSKTFFYFVDAREISRSPDGFLIEWLWGRLLMRLDRKKFYWISNPKVSSRRRPCPDRS